MPIREDRQIAIWLKCFLISIVLVLPARCYTGYYLHALQSTSNLSVQYINLVDLAVAITTIVIAFDKRKIICESATFRVVSIYLIVNFFMLIMAAIFGYADYIGELISKSFIVLCAGIVASKVKEYTDAQKSSIYIIALVILVVASFFLSGYRGYAVMNRVGTLGFGTNETANFACCILAIALFVTNINIWIRVAASVLSFACILNVASRRGMIVAIAIPVIWVLLLLWKKRSSKIASRSFFAALLIIVVGIAIFISKHEQILNYVNSSALMVRYRFAARYNDEFMDYSGRLSIFDEAFEYINNHLFLGSFGCDKILAQGHMAHAHNLLLQFVATNGILVGVFYAAYVVITFVRSIKMMGVYIDRRDKSFPAVISLFYILYFTFEMFGYLLWNPKGLFWIALTMFLIRIEYRNYVLNYSAEKDS